MLNFFNEATVLGVGLGDALMFLAGIFTLLTFRSRLMNMTIDIRNKTTIKELLFGKKKATMTLTQAKLEKRGMATKQMSIALSKKEIALTIRETATAKLRNLQRMLGTKVAKGGNKLKFCESCPTDSNIGISSTPNTLLPQPLVNAIRVIQGGIGNTWLTSQGLPRRSSPLPWVQNKLQS